MTKDTKRGTLSDIGEGVKDAVSGNVPGDVPPMTQEACEAWIMLKGQEGTPVFEIHLVDTEVDKDPTMRALMEALTLMIHQGIMGMPFAESQQQPKPDLKPVA